MTRSTLIFRYRAVLSFFIAALILSGVTAFPLRSELQWLGSLLGIPPTATPTEFTGLRYWIATVRNGLEQTYATYPWMAYGTDWLAFAHIIIAIFFIGPLRDPIRNRWVLQAGLIACGAVPLLAFIAGPLRGIPFYWCVIDSSFGLFGALPLFYCLKLTRRLEQLES